MGNFTVHCLGYGQLHVELCGPRTKFTGDFLGHGLSTGNFVGYGQLYGELYWASVGLAHKVPVKCPQPWHVEYEVVYIG